MDEYEIKLDEDTKKYGLLKNGKLFVDYIYNVLTYTENEGVGWVIAYQDNTFQIPLAGMCLGKHNRMYPFIIVERSEKSCTVRLDTEPQTVEDYLTDLCGAKVTRLTGKKR